MSKSNFDFVEIFSVIIAVLAIIVGTIGIWLSFTPNLFNTVYLSLMSAFLTGMVGYFIAQRFK
ncbi:MAG TPA: hypothetical protein VEC16_03970 [Alphaproteobacteria bacterium]|nr:hypothetical protein [Alphaproteobacteria bacterium]